MTLKFAIPNEVFLQNDQVIGLNPVTNSLTN